MKELKQLYTDLIKELAQRRDEYSEEELTIFSASAGKRYDGKIMIVGRAVNGWKHYLDPNSEQSVLKCISSVHNAIETENLTWVKELWGSGGEYNTKQSAFWRMAKAISAASNPDVDFHTDAIVWTNLYKASKYSGGNPSATLKRTEFHICKQILDAEIDFYKPSHIIFLTGFSWAGDFITDSTTVNPNPSWEFLDRVGIYRGCKFIVGQHPQGKNETRHLSEIVEHLM